MTDVDSNASLQKARLHYFAESGLPADGGYGNRWVQVRIGPIPFAFPNIESRRKIVPAHDLHHVLTGYATDLIGEGELGAWEIGAGCRDLTGLVLQLLVFGFALAWSPRRMFEAFGRGRRCENLLDTRCEGAFLERSVASVRADLGLGQPPTMPTAADRLAFACWASLATAIVWGPLVPLALLAWWLLR